MPAEDNIVKLPDALDAHAKAINTALERRDNSICDWVDANLVIAERLTKARAALPNNATFGAWCDQWFGNCLNKNTRAIYIQWGEKLDWTRTILQKTDRTSIELIHSKEWVSLPSARKTPVKQNPTTPKREQAEASIREHKARTGSYPSVIEAGKESGLSRIVIEPALAAVKAEDSVAPSEIRFTKAQDAHVEARVKALRKALEAEYSERVRLQVLEENAPYRALLEESKREADKRQETYDSLINSHKPIFNDTEFTIILTCLHPDNSASPEKRDNAFKAFNAMKFQLTGKK